MKIDLARLLAESCLQGGEWWDQIGSTNDRALDLANQTTTDTPFLVGTNQQTAGRGRGIHQWWSADGSLLFSIVADMPQFGLDPAKWPQLSLATGLAISEALATFLPAARVGLKWPNDVWVDGRKVCGILIEQANPQRLIVGIGLNVNNSFQTAPENQRRVAISMSDANDGQPFSRMDVLLAFLQYWRRRVQELADGEFQLVERWSRVCVLSGRPVTVTIGQQELTGICAGIDEDGSLLLRTPFALEHCHAGTVRLLD